MQLLTAGVSAPDFTLLDQNGHAVTLSEFKTKHKVLLYFYPKAMTPGCTTQACGLRDTQAQFAAYNTLVFGISPDPVLRLKKFIERDHLNFSLLSDEDHSIAEKFGVWAPKKFLGKIFNGVHRISFLIDLEGNIEKVFDNFKTSNHHQVVLDYLAAHNSQ